MTKRITNQLESASIPPMNILVLVAGTNEPSNSNALADAFIQGMQQHKDVTVHKRRLKDLRIEHFTMDFYDPQCSQEEDFCVLQELVEQADGLVIATPIWNFSVPSHLKNFIDRMGSFALAEDRSTGTLEGLPFFTIYTGGAPMAAWRGLMRFTTWHISAALEFFNATHMGTHYEPKCTKGKGVFGLVVDKRPDTLDGMQKKGFTFLAQVARYKKTNTLPFTKRIYRRAYLIGQRIMGKL